MRKKRGRKNDLAGMFYCIGGKNVSNTDEIIGHAKRHTVKKFELIEKYVEAWAHKLLQNQYCSGLVFIDCMSNSGEYVDDDGNQVFGTPVRVSKYLRDIAGQYPRKQIDLYFSDLSAKKIAHLSTLVPQDKSNFHIHITAEDGNDLAKRIGSQMKSNKHYLLVYDPYDASIDWKAILPFINNWSEVIINHMVSDSIRAVKIVKSEDARNKYEQTYLMDLERLIPFGSDKKAYEQRIETIITVLHRNSSRSLYIAAFPFFNEKNAIVYNLIHCTSNIKGFKLYKQSAWQTFGGKSSTKNTHGLEYQLVLNLSDGGVANTQADEFCYYIKDIADYLQKAFDGQRNVPFDKVRALLDEHPVFPSDGFKKEIRSELRQNYNAQMTRDKISFA